MNSSDPIKKKAIDGARRRYEGEERCMHGGERDHLGDAGVNGTIILKCIREK